MAVLIGASKVAQLLQVAAAIESNPQHVIFNKRQNIGTGSQVESGLGQHGFAGEQRLRDAASKLHRPDVVAVVAIAEGDNKAGVGNGFHLRPKPLRAERSAGPLTAPAYRRKRCLPPAFACSSCWRTRRPTGTPVRREVSLSQARSSSVRRIVNV
ncbi:MAG: hypothetical protein AUH86_15445 [Acidobacteria bacterium 13_1_40CM_4_58_4]|nr:MAG: hypothetical protein AUH86_15445 [Acidobacteria bacterium 13_1_40CM_4_58_4]